jgi:hypothetical protein
MACAANSWDNMLQYHNRNTYPIRFKIGDYVLYKNNAPSNKWDPKFFGPWKIIDQISPVVFELALNGHRFSAHATQLKLYKGTLIAEESEEQMADPIEAGPPDTTDIWVDNSRAMPDGHETLPPEEDIPEPTYLQGPETPARQRGPWSAIKQKVVNFRKEADASARRLVVQLQPLRTEQIESPHRDQAIRHSPLSHDPPPELRRSTRPSKPVERLNL